MPWRTIDGQEVAPRGSVELEVLLKDVEIKGRHPASPWRLKNKDQVNIMLYIHVLIYAAGKDADYILNSPSTLMGCG
jgi:hypothetical protein